ncbi:MAG: antioxidant protein [Pseudomonadota bacterium]|jgi:peroxiredoxin
MAALCMNPGDTLPNLAVETDLGKAQLHDWRGQTLVLYFYPKDDTPGCTVEGQDFSRLHAEFLGLGCQVVGVSRDSVSSHERFIAKHDLSITLIADTSNALCEALGVIKEKNMYGKTVLGIERSTFLFNDKGVLHQAWRGVSVPGHAEAVLQAVKALTSH